MAFIILSYSKEYSTTIAYFDWILFTLPFLSISYVIWLTQFLLNRVVRNIGVFAMVIVFGMGYNLSTVGMLVLGFIIAKYEPDRRIEISKNLEYRETQHGNALSEYRGKRVEVYQRIKWIPIIERRSECKENYNLIVYPDSINIEFDESIELVYLTTNRRKRNQDRVWKDTIELSIRIRGSD